MFIKIILNKLYKHIIRGDEKMIRVLQVFGEPLSNGGQEVFIMNMYRNIDRNLVQFDFFTPFYCNNENMKQEIESMGGKVFIGNSKFETKLRKYNFKKQLKSFLKNNKYFQIRTFLLFHLLNIYLSKVILCFVQGACCLYI